MLSSPRVLIVEDDDDSRELISHMLRSDGNINYQIISAPTAENALSLISSQPFDLYILDYWLPQMTGIELCSHIRTVDSKTPIIFFSARARLEDINLAMAAGADEYMVKPKDLTKITETVKRLLSNYNKDYKLTTQSFTYLSERL
jgi:OmpR-family two-component system manganese-sensing response regulator